MKKYLKTITVYELPDGFVAEVHRDEELSEFYISHKAYGIKIQMLSLCDYDVETEEQILEANAEVYMNAYKAEYCNYIDECEERFM